MSMARLVSTLAALALAALSALSAGCQTPPRETEKSATAAATIPAHFTLPFHLVNGYILIEGQVDQRRGRFMFDTGTEPLFLFNRHVVPLRQDAFMGQGQAASGQPVVVYRQHAPVNAALTGGLRFDGLQDVPHGDFAFLEAAISHEFLGFLGFGFSRDYEFAINYDEQTIVFNALAANKPATHGHKLLLEMPCTPTGSGGKMPELQLQVGEINLTGFFDTGNPGTLELRSETRAALEAAGLLRVEMASYANGVPDPHQRAALSGLSVQGVPLSKVYNLRFSPAEQDRIGLGYQFLKHYVSVWNYRAKTITLLQP